MNFLDFIRIARTITLLAVVSLLTFNAAPAFAGGIPTPVENEAITDMVPLPPTPLPVAVATTDLGFSLAYEDSDGYQYFVDPADLSFVITCESGGAFCWADGE